MLIITYYYRCEICHHHCYSEMDGLSEPPIYCHKTGESCYGWDLIGQSEVYDKPNTYRWMTTEYWRNSELTSKPISHCGECMYYEKYDNYTEGPRCWITDKRPTKDGAGMTDLIPIDCPLGYCR
jgi:hypothetical protein